jgi:hypothetical protein
LEGKWLDSQTKAHVLTLRIWQLDDPITEQSDDDISEAVSLLIPNLARKAKKLNARAKFSTLNLQEEDLEDLYILVEAPDLKCISSAMSYC